MSEIDAGPFANGAVVLRGRDARGRMRYEVHHGEGGAPIRMLHDRGEAVAFAEGLPAPEGLEPIIPPREVSVSPRAAALREQMGLDQYQQGPDPNDGVPSKTMSERRARSGAGASSRAPVVVPRPREGN
jgi:hypothetical protein